MPFSLSAQEDINSTNHIQSIVLGSGCFWGAEKGYEAIPGVISAISGYADGLGVKPNYRAITQLKNRMNLDKWQDANDGWMVKENIQMKYLSSVSNVMTFIEDEDKHVNKIINAIGKKVYLDEDTKKDYI